MNFTSDLVLHSLKKIFGFVMNLLKFLVAKERIANSLHEHFVTYDKLDILSIFYFR